MTDHPLLIPTSKGPVGAIVSEPAGEPEAALILFHGGGPPARCGVNAVWTRIARQIAALGVVVLRFDFAREAESTLVGQGSPTGPAWRSRIDLPVTREIASWFAERAGMEILVAGSCYGARLGMEVAAEDPRIEATFLIAPYLAGIRRGKSKVTSRAEVPVALAVRHEQAETGGDRLGAVAVDAARAILSRGDRLWFLIGEQDPPHALQLREQILACGGPPPEVEVAPGLALHPGIEPVAQQAIANGILARVARELRERRA